MITLHEIPLPELKNSLWEKFKQHHYAPDSWNSAARVFLATEVFDSREVIVGMSAALRQPSGTVKNAWCSHKVVVLPLGFYSGGLDSSEKVLLPDFDRIQKWRAIADAQAAKFVAAGCRYFCNAGDAKPELIAYRDDPASGWVPTSKNGKPPRDKGRGAKYGNKPRCTNAAGLVVSHEYVGRVFPLKMSEERLRKFVASVRAMPIAPLNKKEIPPEVIEEAREIISDGRKVRASKRHPDHGGSESAMQISNAAYQWLLLLINQSWDVIQTRTSAKSEASPTEVAAEERGA